MTEFKNGIYNTLRSMIVTSIGRAFTYTLGHIIIAMTCNRLITGAEITWKTLRNKFDLQSPTQMIGKLRNQGVMIYTNRSSKGVSYRVGTPSKAVIAAGQKAIFGNTAYGA